MVEGAQRVSANPPTLANRWNDASGGLGYHWRAWRYRTRLWAPFHRQVAEWLEAWSPEASTLVLIGPSAGYALSHRFLSRFDRLVVLESDPLARWLLKRRFSGAPWRVGFEDVFHDPDALSRLGAQWPDAAFLFCNVIGQVFSADDLHAWQARHAAWLDAHTWASWHDVFSSDRAPGRLPGPVEAGLGPDASTDVARMLWANQRCEVEDHGSFGWQPDPRYALWRLTPRQWHVIGWVAHRPDSGAVSPT